jgi:hypothetical protein
MPSASVYGSDAEPEMSGDELVPGTTLSTGSYTIIKHLKSGGFGITYLAKDTLGRQVVVKECFPSGISARSTLSVRPRSRTYQASIANLVEKFVAEAHTLAKVNHPNIVKVHQVFRENDTAYMALDYVEGHDLLEVLADPSKKLTPGEVRSSLLVLLDAIALVHETGLLHRDVSPDNILIDTNRNPILIDFGAAREQVAAGQRAASTMHVVKEGYSPQELYLATGDQGPWSDLYSLAATFYHVVSGQAPANSQERLAALASKTPDPVVPLAGRFDAYDPTFLAAIDMAMSVFPKDRIQSARDWIAAITGAVAAASPHPEMGAAFSYQAPAGQADRAKPASSRKPMGPLIMAGVALGFVLIGGGMYLAGAGKPAASAGASDPTVPSAAQGEASVSPTSALQGTDTAATDLAPVTTNWTLNLPFAATEAEPATVDTTMGEVPDWLVPGVKILAVNELPVTGIADIPTVLKDAIDPGDADSLSVTFLIETAEGADAVEHALNLQVTHEITLATGAKFIERPTLDGWQTEVLALPAGYTGEMEVGDIVAANVETNTKVDGPYALKGIFDTALAAGSETATLAVQRNGQMWVVGLPLPK